MDKKLEKKLEETRKQIEKTAKTSLNLAQDLWREAKIYAAEKGLTLTEVVSTALNKYLEEEGKKKK